MVYDIWLLTMHHPELTRKMMDFAVLTGNQTFLRAFALMGSLLQAPDRWRRLVAPRTVEIKDKAGKSYDVLVDPEISFRRPKAVFDMSDLNHDEDIVHTFDYPNLVGQLSLKNEPAGKVRVFAMVDSWTQNLMKPLHELIFAILRSLPNDGTFNQDASFKRSVEKAKLYGCSFGYDLSAATDRLPIEIQVPIVAGLLKILGVDSYNRAAQNWADILTDRLYRLKEPGNAKGGIPTGLRALSYSVGQPMGALSSFAMLGLTHHLIVQMCAFRCGFNRNEWFDRYEVLGDDIQIFDRDVAAEYLIVMRDLGLEVNVAKSVVSPTGKSVEYAKRLSFNGIDVSPIS